MYRYLQTLDQAPVRLVWYPGEGHGNRRAAARLDRAHRLVRWMEHDVTGPGAEIPPVVEKVMENEKDDQVVLGQVAPAHGLRISRRACAGACRRPSRRALATPAPAPSAR